MEVAMKVIRADQVSKLEATAIPLFTGGQVTMQPLLAEDTGKNFSMNLVNFGKGARTKFHSHTSDQVLIVTDGTGIVATEQGERTVGPGDIIHFPAGEKHWHGATKDSEFAHIYVMSAGSETTQLED
jgi:quercetin dioxygenase-like cupin family protein